MYALVSGGGDLKLSSLRLSPRSPRQHHHDHDMNEAETSTACPLLTCSTQHQQHTEAAIATALAQMEEAVYRIAGGGFGLGLARTRCHSKVGVEASACAGLGEPDYIFKLSWAIVWMKSPHKVLVVNYLRSKRITNQLIMSQITPAQYLISLCTLAQDCEESFGIAMRIGASNSKFNVEATKVIHGILTFSPAPDAVAVEFLNELEKVKGIAFLGQWLLCVPAGFC
jgi:hypothetical protein